MPRRLARALALAVLAAGCQGEAAKPSGSDPPAAEKKSPPARPKPGEKLKME